MGELKIGKGLSLPVDAVTETFAVLGRRGSGKTYTANVLCEELLAAGQQIVVLDPLDVWWGLRSDGKGGGYPIVIFGGEHADVPLEPRSGALLADVIVEERLRAILSLRHLSKQELRNFVADFGERLYERKGKAEHRSPLHLVIDEADAVVPQRLFPGAERAFGAIDTLVRRDRSSGVGTTLISQRAAVIAKDVLTQTEVLICHQTTGPQDRKALEAWIEAHDTGNRKKAFLESIAGLKRGTAWVWSPAWLDLFQRVEIRQRRTFDSSSTPKAGARALPAAPLAPVRLDSLRTRIAETVERAKADDPKALRARIAELERQLAKKPAPPAQVVDRPVFDEAGLAAVHELAFNQIGAIEAAAADARAAIGRALNEYRGRCRAAVALGERGVSRVVPPARPAEANPISRETNGAGTNGAGTNLPKVERLILTALAQHQGRAMTRERLALLVGYHANSKAFANGLGALRGRGCVEGLTITEQGFRELGHYETLPTGIALLEWYCANKLRPAEARILRAIWSGHGRLTRDELAAEVEYHPNAKAFANGLGRLRGLGLVEGLQLAPELRS